jgi:hypothetical protein
LKTDCASPVCGSVLMFGNNPYPASISLSYKSTSG